MKFNKPAKIVKWSCVIFLLCVLTFQAKSQVVVFENGTETSSTDFGNSVIEAPDSTLIIVGSTTADSEGLADIKVSKLTWDGTEIWSVTHGGFNNDFPAHSIMLEDGSFVIVGTTGSFTDTPSRDVYLLKMNSEGDILWTHSYGGAETDEGTDIKESPEGDFIITAFTESYGEGEREGWLLKTDSEGNLLWDQTFGGSEMDVLWGVDISPDGGYILAGGTHSFSEGAGEDFWLIKTDTSGNEIWNQTYGVADRTDLGRDVVATLDGYVAVGISDNDQSNPPPASGDAFIIKVDFDGNMVWEQLVTGVFRVEGFSISPSQDGGWIVGGTKVQDPSYAAFWVVKANEQGEVLWEVESGQPGTVGIAFDVIQTYNGDIVATGFSGFTQSSPQDLHLLRLTDQTVSIPEGPEALDVFAMPNPTNGYLKVVLDENQPEGSLLLSNAAGKVVKHQKFGRTDVVELDLSGFPAGMYVIQVKTTEGVGQARVVKY